jgi:hypothetical protein
MSFRTPNRRTNAVVTAAVTGLLIAAPITLPETAHAAQSSSTQKIKSWWKNKLKKKSPQGGALYDDGTVRKALSTVLAGQEGWWRLRAADQKTGRYTEFDVHKVKKRIGVYRPGSRTSEQIDLSTGTFTGSEKLRNAHVEPLPTPALAPAPRPPRVAAPARPATGPELPAVREFVSAGHGATAEVDLVDGANQVFTFKLTNQHGEVFAFGWQSYEGLLVNPRTGAFPGSERLTFWQLRKTNTVPLLQNQLRDFQRAGVGEEAVIKARLDGVGPVREYQVSNEPDGKTYVHIWEAGSDAPRSLPVSPHGLFKGSSRLTGAELVRFSRAGGKQTVSEVLQVRNAPHQSTAELVADTAGGGVRKFFAENRHGQVHVSRVPKFADQTPVVADPRTGAFPGSQGLRFRPVRVRILPDNPTAQDAVKEIRFAGVYARGIIKGRANGEGPVREFEVTNVGGLDKATGFNAVAIWETGVGKAAYADMWGGFLLGQITSDQLTGVEFIRTAAAPIQPVPTGQLYEKRMGRG